MPIDLKAIERQLRENARKHKAWSRKMLKELGERRKVALKEDFMIGRCGCGTILPQGQNVCGMCMRY